MSKEDTVIEAADSANEKGIFIGDGSTPNYPALILFLAGGVLGGLAVFDSVRRGGSYVALLATALLCAVVSFALIVMKGRKK
jgi:hypothetical protein